MICVKKHESIPVECQPMRQMFGVHSEQRGQGMGLTNSQVKKFDHVNGGKIILKEFSRISIR